MCSTCATALLRRGSLPGCPAAARLSALPHSPEAVAQARRLLDAALDEAGWSGGSAEEARAGARLAASELTTNAVLHGAAWHGELVGIAAVTPDEAFFAVANGGEAPGIEPVALADARGTSGRGLGIVGALASSWGIERADGVTVAWFRLVRPAAT